MDATTLEGWRQELSAAEPTRLEDGRRLDLLRSLEDLSRAVAATAVRVQVAFRDSQVAQQAARGLPVSRQGEAVADDLAHARRTSPHRASRELVAARALVEEMPRTLAALAAGTIDATQARLVTEATACLSAQDRAEVDRRLEESLEGAGASTRRITAAARALAYEVDPAGFVAGARRAAKERGVSVRPAPDVMALLTARLPAPQAVACYAALRKHAERMAAKGDPRTLQQLMADEFYARLTGRQVVDGVDVEVGLVMTDAALFGGDSCAPDLQDYGPVPAEVARDLLQPGAAGERPDEQTRRPDGPAASECPDGPAASECPDGPAASECPDGSRCARWDCALLHCGPPSAPAPPPSPCAPSPPSSSAPTAPASSASSPRPGDDAVPDADSVRAATVWVRRLYADPSTGVLRSRDPRRRLFTGSLRAALVARGRYCANAWCAAPIRHIDHVDAWREGGPTTEDNGRGLCARCNLARERERCRPPAPEDYRSPPPVLDGFLGGSGFSGSRHATAADDTPPAQGRSP